MSKANPFPVLMRAFFYEWLVEQRNASIHTVRSYRDTWRLFLGFVAQRAGRKVAMITMTDLAASEVAAFLSYAEHERSSHDQPRATVGLPQSAASSTLWRPGIPHRSRNASKSSTSPSSARRYRSPVIWIRRK